MSYEQQKLVVACASPVVSLDSLYDWPKNKTAQDELLEEIDKAQVEADLLVFPEDHLGFNREVNSHAIDGLVSYAIKHNICVLVGGLVTTRNNGKTAFLLTPDGQIRYHIKTQLRGGERTPPALTPGSEFDIFHIRNIGFGVAICSEFSISEIMHIYAAKGAEIVISPATFWVPLSESGSRFTKLASKYYLLNGQAQAMQNGIFAVVVNANLSPRSNGFSIEPLHFAVAPDGELLKPIASAQYTSGLVSVYELRLDYCAWVRQYIVAGCSALPTLGAVRELEKVSTDFWDKFNESEKRKLEQTGGTGWW